VAGGGIDTENLCHDNNLRIICARNNLEQR